MKVGRVSGADRQRRPLGLGRRFSWGERGQESGKLRANRGATGARERESRARDSGRAARVSALPSLNPSKSPKNGALRYLAPGGVPPGCPPGTPLVAPLGTPLDLPLDPPWVPPGKSPGKTRLFWAWGPPSPLAPEDTGKLSPSFRQERPKNGPSLWGRNFPDTWNLEPHRTARKPRNTSASSGELLGIFWEKTGKSLREERQLSRRSRPSDPELSAVLPVEPMRANTLAIPPRRLGQGFTRLDPGRRGATRRDRTETAAPGKPPGLPSDAHENGHR